MTSVMPPSGSLLPKRDLAERAMRRSWFPVARSADLAKPQQATLLGVNLVVFRRADGVAAVLPSRCPHRGGSFVIGAQHGNDIACSYHGWRFSGETGRCTYIPSLEDQAKIPPKAKVKVYPVVERFGHVWTCLEDPVVDMYDLAEWHDVNLEWLAATPLDSPTGVAVAIENFRDVAHFPFVHRETMGDVPEVVEPLNVRRDGLDVWMDRELLATEGEWNNSGDQTMRYHCVAPGLAAITFTSSTLGTRVVAGFPSPIAFDHVKIFWGVANEVGYKGSTLGESLELEQRVYREDLPIAERIEPREVPWDNEFEEFSAPADLFTLNYRRAFTDLMGRVDNPSPSA
ncbi:MULTISPECIES: aromatic ring-hydroxylating dioxygenase subunit alpha [unclassified Mycolicibacterium]|uniref:aromatic ring-hydroxylating oxygenase subunit alpha n=1 Tax=unclassified Mycolicibacterium TaxID=2636767 RepID=UPI001EE49C69|nr:MULTISPECIES: aromatic ring-hydroxylating dioxygenase subunit alpha [unclassified Mycolicibacterium]